jgi:hypothetical protein
MLDNTIYRIINDRKNKKGESMKTEKNEFNDIVKKHNIKIVMCGDDKTIPKIIHARIKSTCDEIMDPFSDVKWRDVYSIMEDIYKQGVKHGKEKK